MANLWKLNLIVSKLGKLKVDNQRFSMPNDLLSLQEDMSCTKTNNALAGIIGYLNGLSKAIKNIKEINDESAKLFLQNVYDCAKKFKMMSWTFLIRLGMVSGYL